MALVVNGWTLLYHPVFGDRYAALRDEARELKKRLGPEEWRQHPVVKLAAGVRRMVMEVVLQNPLAPAFRLRGDLAAFCRASGLALPPRYRLCWVASPSTHTVIFLYLNDETTLRKEGAKTDPYEVFRGLVRRGEIGPEFASNRAAWERAQRSG